MNKIRRISLFWLVFLFGFILGLYVYNSKVWPYKPLRQVKRFITGHVSENLSLLDKIENDLNFKPNRHIKVAEKKRGTLVEI